MNADIRQQTHNAISELIQKANLKSGDILVVGCSSSEIIGRQIGTESSVETARIVFDELYSELKTKGIFMAAQCCEHLNRAIVVEKVVALRLNIDIVNAVPQPKAGGSFASAAYQSFSNPVVVEKIKADAGIDIGGTLIGMHLKEVAVPLRLSVKKIGDADVIYARTRPKFIGGSRASYDDNLK